MRPNPVAHGRAGTDVGRAVRVLRSAACWRLPAWPTAPTSLDSRVRSLTRGGERVGLSPCEYEVLHLLVYRANVVLSKDVPIRAGWRDIAVRYNSLEKLVGNLRRRLDAGDLGRYIRTVPAAGGTSSAAPSHPSRVLRRTGPGAAAGTASGVDRRPRRAGVAPLRSDRLRPVHARPHRSSRKPSRSLRLSTWP